METSQFIVCNCVWDEDSVSGVLRILLEHGNRQVLYFKKKEQNILYSDKLIQFEYNLKHGKTLKKGELDHY